MQATYVYDALGNRLEKDVWTQASGLTTVTRFAYDGSNTWADLNGSNQLQMRRLYLDGVDHVFARINSGGTAAWYLPDRLGSIRDITDQTGAVQDHVNYDGFGNVTNESSTTFGDRYKFTAREFDTETGLQDNRARYYDPRTGRWTSQDPKGFAAGDGNLYRYVGNAPTVGTDPTGLEILIQDITIDDTGTKINKDAPPMKYNIGINEFSYGFKVKITACVSGKSKLSDLSITQDIFNLSCVRKGDDWWTFLHDKTHPKNSKPIQLNSEQDRIWKLWADTPVDALPYGRDLTNWSFFHEGPFEAIFPDEPQYEFMSIGREGGTGGTNKVWLEWQDNPGFNGPRFGGTGQPFGAGSLPAARYDYVVHAIAIRVSVSTGDVTAPAAKTEFWYQISAHSDGREWVVTSRDFPFKPTPEFPIIKVAE